MALAALPEAVGRLLAAPGGALPFIGSDLGVYYAYIEQVRQGHWLFRDVFTTEAQPHRFLNISWLAVGLIARVTGLGPEWAFPAARLAAIPLVMAALLHAARTFLADVADRKLFLWLAGLGAGWGAWWVVGRTLLGLRPLGMELPIDLWVPEATVLLSALYSPHFLLSLAALVAAVSGAFRFAQRPAARPLALSAVALLLLAQFHTYYGPVVVAVVGAGFLASAPTGRRFWTLLGAVALLGACVALGTLPYGWLSLTDVTTVLRNASNRTPMPGPLMAVLAAGALLPAALAALWRGRRGRTAAWRSLGAWLVVQASFVYAPIPWQRKMTEGLIVPLALLAAPELRLWWGALAARMPRSVRGVAAAAAFGLVFCATTLMNVLSTSHWFVNPFPVWITADDRAAFAWMRERLPEDATLVAVAERANGIAAFTARTVYVGHWAETVGFEAKYRALVWLAVEARDDAARLRFLRSAGITHVYVGPLERQVWRWEPSGAPGFSEVYRAGEVAVYAVDGAGATLQP